MTKAFDSDRFRFVLPTLDARIMNDPPSSEELTNEKKYSGRDIDPIDLFSYQEKRMSNEPNMKYVLLRTIEYNLPDTDQRVTYAAYIDTQSISGIYELPEGIRKAIFLMADLPPRRRESHCYNLSNILVDFKIAQNRYRVIPETFEHIRAPRGIGFEAYHDFAGIDLGESGFAYFDSTFPPMRNSSSVRSPDDYDLPYGLIIWAKTKQRADQIATFIYGGTPQVQKK